MESPEIKVMLVDDHEVVRMGFRLLLEGHPGLQVCAEAESGEQACRLYAQARPDVLVLDLSMAGMGGMEALGRILAHDPSARVLVLSAFEDLMHPRRLMRAGARGYLSKRCAAQELITAILQIARGDTYLDPLLQQALENPENPGTSNPLDLLSEREFEVFMQLAAGATVNDIAETLFLSPRTVGTHLYNIKQKLDAKNQAELTLIALRNQLLAP